MILKHVSNHRPALNFFEFSKIREYDLVQARSKQNREINSAAILTIAAYENELLFPAKGHPPWVSIKSLSDLLLRINIVTLIFY